MAKEVVRAYNYSDGALKQKSDLLVLNLTRDAAAFAARGETPATITGLQEMIDDFDAFPTDEELEGVINSKTIVKDNLAKTLRMQMRIIRGIADATYNGEGLYNCFGFEGMDKMDDAHLHRLAQRVVRVSTTLFDALSAKGLNNDMIIAVGKTDSSFDDAMDSIREAEENRDIATQQRRMLGNTLYAEYSRLMNIGKSIFQDTDEARYNDYVMNDEPPVKPAKAA